MTLSPVLLSGTNRPIEKPVLPYLHGAAKDLRLLLRWGYVTFIGQMSGYVYGTLVTQYLPKDVIPVPLSGQTKGRFVAETLSLFTD
jgi:hypothetical protein